MLHLVMNASLSDEKLLLLSCFSRVQLCVTPEMAAYQALLEWVAISFSNA